MLINEKVKTLKTHTRVNRITIGNEFGQVPTTRLYLEDVTLDESGAMVGEPVPIAKPISVPFDPSRKIMSKDLMTGAAKKEYSVMELAEILTGLSYEELEKLYASS